MKLPAGYKVDEKWWTPGRGMPVVVCDRCGTRMGMRSIRTHDEAHRIVDGLTERTRNQAVGRHLGYIAEYGKP